MAIIYSYPYIAPKPKDLMIGTSVVEPFDSNSNEDESTTVSWQLQDIINMIATSTGQQTLQQVTSIGDSTTNPVILNNYLSLGGAVLDKTGSAGVNGQILSSTVAGTAWVANTGQGVTSVTGSTPIVSSGGLTPAISLAASGVSIGTYANPTITVDTYGRITTASGSSAPVSSFSSAFNTTGFISGTTNITTTGAVDIGTVDLNATGLAASAADRAGQFLRGDNSWATPAAGYVNWKASGDNQTPAVPITVTNGFDLKFTGYIDPAATGGAGIVTDSAISANEMTVALAYTGGTPSATTFYRGDGQWAVPGGGGITGSGAITQITTWDSATSVTGAAIYTIDSSNNVSQAADTDVKNTIGRAVVDGGTISSDFATFTHIDRQGALDYAFMASPFGSTFINASGASQTVQILDDNGSCASFDSDLTQLGSVNVQLPQYGSGTVTGTATYSLSVDSTGKIIETANPSTSLLKTAVNSFTASQILAGGTVSYTMPSVPVGKQFLIVNQLWYLDAGSTPFNAPTAYSGFLNFNDGSSSTPIGAIINGTNWINSAIDIMQVPINILPSNYPSVIGAVVTTGGGTMDLVLPTGASGNAPTTGNGELYISIEYKEIATGSAFTL